MAFRFIFIIAFLIARSYAWSATNADDPSNSPDFESFRAASSKLVPAAGDVPGLTISKGPAFYGPHNLWNYIDGGALPYVEYGVVGAMTCTGLFSPDSLRLTIDCYDMGGDLAAFGIYRSESDTGATLLSIGAEGYFTGPGLFFRKGRWYVKVVAATESPRARAVTEATARWLDRRIQGSIGPPRLLAVFPSGGRVPRSETFIAKDVLGQEFLKKALSVEYAEGTASYRLFLIDSAVPDSARAHFKGCREYIRESGGADTAPVSLGDEAFTGIESFYGRVVFGRSGRYILVSAGLTDTNRARELLAAMMKNLGAIK